MEESKFSNFIKHPVTKEVLRFVGFTLVTVGGRFVIGRALESYRAKQAKTLNPAARQQSAHPPVQAQA
jgi:hypothetical protein